MKKQFILAGLLVAGFASAQTDKDYLGKVGINIMTPQATIDIRPNDDNRQETATTNEGILIPKLSKTRVANIEDALLVEGTLVYVTDDASSSIASYAGSNAKVAKITEKGYYYYNGTEWVKSGVGANDQLWAQRPNAEDPSITETYLKPANTNGDYVGYRSDRKWGLNLGNAQESDFDWGNGVKGFVASEVPSSIAITSDVLPITSTIGTNNDYYYFSNDNYLLKNAHVSANPSAVYLGKEHRFVIKDVTSSARYILGLNSSVDYNSIGKVTDLISLKGGLYIGENAPSRDAVITNSIAGQFLVNNQATSTNIVGADILLQNGGMADNLYGIRNNTKSSTLTTVHTVKDIIGIDNQVTLSDNGTVQKKFMAMNNILNIGKSTTTDGSNIRGVYNEIRVGVSNVNVDVDNITSVIVADTGSVLKRYQGFVDYPVIRDGVKLDSYSGFYVSNSEIASTAEIQNIYGLRVLDITKGKTANYAIHTGKGKVRFGDDVESTGTVTASSFKGTNGATIFPDYVFQKYYTGNSSIKADYTFKSLSQVEDFVKTNGHLPGYKSAEAIKAQGYVDLMETQLTNVEKIEELYLHSIEQEKNLKELRKENEELKTRLEKLEKLLK